jgi:hypothetical protein
LREEILRGDDPELAESIDGFAMLLVEAGEVERAEALLRRSLAVHEASGGSDAIGHGRTWSAIGHLRMARDEPRASVDAYQRALDLLEPRLAASHPLLLETQRGYDLAMRAARLTSEDISLR